MKYRELVHVDGLNVFERPTVGAVQVMVRLHDIRVVAVGSTIWDNNSDLAHGDQFVEGVVDGRSADLGQQGCRAFVHALGGQVDVVPARD